MPPILGLVAAAIIGAAIFVVAWWNRANQRIDATARTAPAERYDPVAEAVRILEEAS